MSSTSVPSKWDTAARQVAVVLGVAAAAWAVVNAVLRILEIAPDRAVPVTAAFADTPATMPIGLDGSVVEVVAVTIALVCLTIRDIIRGRAFGDRLRRDQEGLV